MQSLSGKARRAGGLAARRPGCATGGWTFAPSYRPGRANLEDPKDFRLPAPGARTCLRGRFRASCATGALTAKGAVDAVACQFHQDHGPGKGGAGAAAPGPSVFPGRSRRVDGAAARPAGRAPGGRHGRRRGGHRPGAGRPGGLGAGRTAHPPRPLRLHRPALPGAGAGHVRRSDPPPGPAPAAHPVGAVRPAAAPGPGGGLPPGDGQPAGAATGGGPGRLLARTG